MDEDKFSKHLYIDPLHHRKLKLLADNCRVTMWEYLTALIDYAAAKSLEIKLGSHQLEKGNTK